MTNQIVELLEELGLTLAQLQLGKEELRKLWVIKLKEFPEKQISNRLGKCDTDQIKGSYCCLGIAGLIAAPEKCIILEGYATNSLGIQYSYEDEETGQEYIGQESDLLPKVVYKELGLRDGEGSLKEGFLASDGETYGSLAHMNDAGISWAEIADLIETRPDLVFID